MNYCPIRTLLVHKIDVRNSLFVKCSSPCTCDHVKSFLSGKWSGWIGIDYYVHKKKDMLEHEKSIYDNDLCSGDETELTKKYFNPDIERYQFPDCLLKAGCVRIGKRYKGHSPMQILILKSKIHET